MTMLARWRENLKRNWPYMVTGTLLSVFLWVAVSANQVRQEAIPADLVIIVTDPAYVLTRREPPIQSATVVFTGRAGDLAALLVARPQIQVRIDSVQSLLVEVPLTPEMVTARGGQELGDVRAASVRPDRIRLHFQPKAEKLVPVVARLRVRPARGYVFADSVRVDPSVVQISGPEAAVTRIDSVLTTPITRDPLRESLVLDVPLEQPDPGGLVELSSSTVQVTVEIEPYAERVFPGVPVSVSGADVGSVRVDPPLVDIRISGPRSVVASIKPETLSPTVRLRGPGDLGARLPIVLPPPGPFVQVRIDPDSALVRPVEGTR
jgi:hypothetical protein